MTAAAKAINPKTYGAIHACRKQVAGLADDAAWRALLVRVTGKDSLRAMTGPQLGKVIDELHRLGARKAPPKRAFKGRQRPLADGEQARLIRALWLDLWNLGAIEDSSEEALASFVKRQAKVDALEWLPADKAASVIQALRGWLARPVEKGGGGVEWKRFTDPRAAIQWAINARIMELKLHEAAQDILLSPPRPLDETIARLGKIIRAELAQRARDGRKGADG